MTEITCNAYDACCCAAETLQVNPLERSGSAIRKWLDSLMASASRRRRERHASDYLQAMNEHDLRDIGMERTRLDSRPVLDLRHRLLLHRNWF